MALTPIDNTENLFLSGISDIENTFNINDLSNDTVIAAEFLDSIAKVALGTIRNWLYTSPAFTGVPTAPTAIVGTSTNQIATTAFVTESLEGIGLLPASASDFGTVKTDLNDPNPTVYLVSTVDNLLSSKADNATFNNYLPLVGGDISGNLTVSGSSSFQAVTVLAPSNADNSSRAASTSWIRGLFAPLASPTLTGTPLAPTAPTANNSDQIATTSHVQANRAILQSAINLKADANNAVLTGSPTAPTTALTNNTTQLATTAFVQAIKQSLHPVGSIYINATNNTNPSTLLGFGTWDFFGAGRVLVGFNNGESEFNAAEKTGGSKTQSHTLSDAGQAMVTAVGNTIDTRRVGMAERQSTHRTFVTSGENTPIEHTLGTGLNGSTDVASNLQPFITVYMWKRTA